MGGPDASRKAWKGSDAGDVGDEEVDAVAVEVAAGTVVVLRRSGVSVPGEDLGVGQWYAFAYARSTRGTVELDARIPPPR